MQKLMNTPQSYENIVLLTENITININNKLC